METIANDYGTNDRFNMYRRKMYEQLDAEYYSHDYNIASFPIIVSNIWTASGEIDTSVTPVLVSIITGWKISVEENGNIIYEIDNPQGMFGGMWTQSYVEVARDGIDGILDIEKVDINNLTGFFEKMATALECYAKLIGPADNYSTRKNMLISTSYILYQAQVLYRVKHLHLMVFQ